jgi:UDP-N-acetyl-D-glucosamine dehydrogenase
MTPHVVTRSPRAHTGDRTLDAPSPARPDRHSSPTLAVLGLGYVGLPTSLAATAAGLDVIGIDTSADRLRNIRGGEVDLLERDHERLTAALESGALRTTASANALSRADVVLICVPTPVHEDHQPDLRALRAACKTAVRQARHGQTIILTSTSYVGTTADLLVAPLRERGLEVGEDIHVAFSPERIDPGNTTHTQEDTPRVVGGATDICAERAASVLSRLTTRIHRVSSMEAAELTKLYENTFRAVNIAFAYEMADAAKHYGLDPIEVTEAAATKPYGFMPFYPGPGVGGHCIPCDPHYLLDPLRTAGNASPLIEQAMGAIAERPQRVAARACELLGDPFGQRVLVAGVSYKPGVQDVRESPALEVLAALERAGCEIGYYDPLVPTLRLGSRTLHGQIHPRGADWDLVVISTVHPGWDYRFLDTCPQLLDATYRVEAGYDCHVV